MTSETALAEQRFVLEHADWNLYEGLLARVGDQHVFITYDRGRLELMSPSWRHDRRARRLGLLVGFIADALDLRIEGGGSTTFRREDLDRGLEPDQCFYIAHVDRVGGREAIDLQRDPPPDLAIEVEISHRSMDRASLYAALGVPELWRDDGTRIRVFRLGESGTYEACERSPAFPSVSISELQRLMDLGETKDETTWSRTVRAWAKESLGQR